MDIGKAVTFITEDERWLEKLGIGVALLLITGVASMAIVGIVGGFILVGYMLRLLQNVRDGQATPLPEWNQWGEDLTRGFKLFLVGLVWGLPLIVFIVPLVIGGIIADSGGNTSEGLGIIIIMCSTCLMSLYGLFLAVMTPGYTIAFAKDETVRSGLQITAVWHWTMRHLGPVVIAALVSMAFGAVLAILSLAGVIACVIGVVVTVPLAVLVSMAFQYHLYGQLAREFPLDVNAAVDGTVSMTNA